MWDEGVYCGGCGFTGSALLRSCRLGGLASGAVPGGVVTNWKALPDDGFVSNVGDVRGIIDINPAVGVVSPPEWAGIRLDHRNLVAPPPVGVTSGEEEEIAGECSLTGISLGGAFTGEGRALGRSN